MLLRSACLVLILAPSLLWSASKSGEKDGPPPEAKAVAMSGIRVEFPPFYMECDVGESKAEQQKTVARFQKPIIETANFFLQIYSLSNKCFDEYADFYSRGDGKFEKLIRFRLWKKYEDFKGDFQWRYKTRTVPGAFFGITKLQDEYGKDTATWIRELATAAEGEGDEQILRHFYHEMGHLFMRTFIVRQVEVPSWIEEGTAELFQFRKGNGTKPEADRDQRQGWLVEFTADGQSIPWAEFVNVQNLDNLGFTYKDPLRSTIQYSQAWSVMEFMISNSARQEAFTKLLKEFKKEGEEACNRAAAAGLKGDAFLEKVRPALYEVQDKVFKKCYGAELLAVEANWKDWIRKEYEKDVKKKPILRYHRGEWWVGLRARFAKTEEEKTACIAKAEAIFKECVEQSPKLPEGYVGLGRVAMERGDLDGASSQFAKAIELGSENFEALLYGGIAKIRTGKAAEAVPALTKATAQRPTLFECNFYLGQALAMSDGDLPLTLTHLSRARDVNPGQTVVCALIEGAANYRKGKSKQAYLSWLRAANADESNALAPLLMAVAQNDLDPDEAVSILTLAKSKGNPAADRLLQLITAKQPLPKVVFNERGWPTLSFDGQEGRTGKADPGADKGGKGKGKDATSSGFTGFGD